MRTDVAIIGAGLMGSAIARELSKYKLDVTIIEKGADVCSGSSKATSAIVHSSYNEMPGTLKARLGVKGNELFAQLCKEIDVPFKRIGSLMVAVNEDDIKIIESKKAQGDKVGVPDLRIIEREELKEMEPNISEEALAALYAPTGATVSPFEMVIALMENARDNGINLILDAPVLNIEKADGLWSIETPKQTVTAKYIFNTAGIFADEISAMAGDDSFKISPAKGEEYLFDRNVGGLVKHVIETASLGVIALPTVHDNLMIGTTRVTTDKNDFSTSKEAFDSIFERVKKVVKGLSPKDVITSFAGLRAINDITEDFIIAPSKKVKNLINISIGSPGVYSTPAVAKMAVEILKENASLETNENFNPIRKAIVEFKSLPKEEQEKWIKKDERYGHVVCRCETVTEGQIVEAIHRGARTLDGIKFRTRAGMGRCHGGFCTSKVLKIMSRELGIPVTEITKKGEGSVIMPFNSKDLLKEIVVDESN